MKFSFYLKIVCLGLFIFSIFFSRFVKGLAQQKYSIVEEFCPFFVQNLDRECEKLGIEKCRERVEECEKYYQQKSNQYQSEIEIIEKKKKTLQNEIYFLSTQIKNLNYKIYKNNLMIKDLNLQLKDTQHSIEQTNKKIIEIKKNLANILQFRYEEDQKTFLEIFFTGKSLADFFDNLMALEALSIKTQEFLVDIKELKNSLQSQKEKMLEDKEELERALIVVKLQKEKTDRLKNKKNQILAQTKGKETLYQRYLEDYRKKAQELRKKIFELAQVSQSQALTLEQAYHLAVEVERITGVRPAFLLGILKVESDIGKNVGQCNCGDSPFCRHPEIHWKEVMRPRQWPYFEKITKELRLNPETTPVSCAINGGKVQWGGAMGPAQFMPETWLRLGYKKRVEQILGITPANPWRVKDAFLAAGLYLADWGAFSQRKIDEIGAATAYLCGTNKMTKKCRISGGKSYIYQIMKFASRFQDYIDQGIFKD